MKKIFAIMLAGVIALSVLAGCGSMKPTEPTELLIEDEAVEEVEEPVEEAEIEAEPAVEPTPEPITFLESFDWGTVSDVDMEEAPLFVLSADKELTTEMPVSTETLLGSFAEAYLVGDDVVDVAPASELLGEPGDVAIPTGRVQLYVEETEAETQWSDIDVLIPFQNEAVPTISDAFNGDMWGVEGMGWDVGEGTADDLARILGEFGAPDVVVSPMLPGTIDESYLRDSSIGHVYTLLWSIDDAFFGVMVNDDITEDGAHFSVLSVYYTTAYTSMVNIGTMYTFSEFMDACGIDYTPAAAAEEVDEELAEDADEAAELEEPEAEEEVIEEKSIVEEEPAPEE